MWLCVLRDFLVSEAYMIGDIQVDDLKGAMKVCTRTLSNRMAGLIYDLDSYGSKTRQAWRRLCLQHSLVSLQRSPDFTTAYWARHSRKLA